MISRLYTSSRLLSATLSYKLRPQGMTAQRTDYQLQDAGLLCVAYVASCTELATAVCRAGYAPAHAACQQHSYMCFWEFTALSSLANHTAACT
jgi:hypothetical protein